MLQIEGDIPLVVNLDGTLLKSDPRLETFFHLLAKDPRAIIYLLRWLRGERSELKIEVADRAALDEEPLPYDPALIDFLRNKRANGRRLVLISRASQPTVDRIAKHFDLFDEAHGASPKLNLYGDSRATFLAERFGEGRFDYLATNPAERPVWSKARRVVTAGASSAQRSLIDREFPEAEHINPAKDSGWKRLKACIAALRPDQWVKNLLIFVPVAADHAFRTPVLIEATIAFAAFCLTASSVYLLNDLVDLPHDRKHPWKHLRPFASGRVPLLYGIIMIFVLLGAAAALSAALLNPAFMACLGLYYLTTLLYSLRLKRILVIDMITLAGLYTIRVVAGGAATGIPMSEWLLALSMFMFLSLAAVKRQSELMDLLKREGNRAPGRRYVVADLPMIQNFATSAGYISVLVLALYISNPAVNVLYARPWLLWGTCPLLLYWISRMLMKAHRGDIHTDPIVFAFRDRASVVTALAIVAVVLAAAVSWP